MRSIIRTIAVSVSGSLARLVVDVQTRELLSSAAPAKKTTTGRTAIRDDRGVR
jgi:hypothetical protein